MSSKKIFTPEVLSSIPGMVKQNMKPGEIAEKIGCKAASLKVTCSNYGISLRRPGVMKGVAKRRRESRPLILSKSAVVALHLQAEIRRVDVNALARNLLETIVRDKLINAVLDDASAS